jgi:tetratricopeptide (TPR) repeat protein
VKRLLLLFLFAGGVGHAVRGQTPADQEFDVTAQQGIAFVYNLEFERADSQFTTLVRLNPRHPAGYFMLAMVNWWRILIDMDNEGYDQQFYADLDHVVDMCDSMLDVNENDIGAIFFKGGAIGFKGRLKFHRDDYLAAANAGRKALPLVQTAMALDPNNYDILLGSGMYNYYAEVIPNEYHFLKPLLLFVPPGDKTKGIEQLTLASERAKYASIEAAYFLLQVYYFYEKDYGKALRIALSLVSRFPDNVVFQRYVGRCYVSMGNWDMARSAFAEISDRVRKGQRGYTMNADREADYYLGVYAMLQHDYDTALQYLYRCDEASRALDKKEPSGFMAMANLKIGMVYDLQKRRSLARMQYGKVLDMKNFGDSQRLAERYQKTPYTD